MPRTLNGLAAETPPGGPFPSRHVVCHCVSLRVIACHCVSLRVDAWQCARTYGVQRPGKTSGACNRSLCQFVSVLSDYMGVRTARLTGACQASRAAGSPPFCSGWAAAGLVRTCGRGRLPDRPAPSRRGCHGGGERCARRPRVEGGTVPWRVTLRAASYRNGVPGVPLRTGSD